MIGASAGGGWSRGRRRSDAVADLLEQAHARAPLDLATAVSDAAALEGWSGAVALVVDFQQEQLTPLPGRSGQGGTVTVEGSVPGRAFMVGAPIVVPNRATDAAAPAAAVVNAPLLDGVERVGVLRVRVPSAVS